MLALTGNEHLILTRLVLTTGRWSMASLLARMLTSLLGFATGLLTYFASIFALSAAMTRLAAEVRTTFESSAADFTAANVRKPTRLVLKPFLLTHACLFHEEGAFWT